MKNPNLEALVKSIRQLKTHPGVDKQTVLTLTIEALAIATNRSSHAAISIACQTILTLIEEIDELLKERDKLVNQKIVSE